MDSQKSNKNDNDHQFELLSRGSVKEFTTTQI